jgi:phosphoribosylformylglycinamidine (FGAM) synthase-like amidotransferase family enzyme
MRKSRLAIPRRYTVGRSQRVIAKGPATPSWLAAGRAEGLDTVCFRYHVEDAFSNALVHPDGGSNSHGVMSCRRVFPFMAHPNRVARSGEVY